MAFACRREIERERERVGLTWLHNHYTRIHLYWYKCHYVGHTMNYIYINIFYKQGIVWLEICGLYGVLFSFPFVCLSYKVRLWNSCVGAKHTTLYVQEKTWDIIRFGCTICAAFACKHKFQYVRKHSLELVLVNVHCIQINCNDVMVM